MSEFYDMTMDDIHGTPTRHKQICRYRLLG